jgi:hypothetical protein
MTALLTSSNDFILIGEKREDKRFMVSSLLLMGRRGNRVYASAMPKP